MEKDHIETIVKGYLEIFENDDCEKPKIKLVKHKPTVVEVVIYYLSCTVKHAMCNSG